MKKKYSEPTIDVVKFSFEYILKNTINNSDPEETIDNGGGGEVPGGDPFGDELG